MVQTAAQVFRDYVTDGVPGSGKHSPAKSQIRDLLSAVEAAAFAPLVAFSSTPMSATEGNKTFDVATAPHFGIGARIRIARASAPQTFMVGVVIDIDGLSVEALIDHATSGSGSDWIINLSGEEGPEGPGTVEPMNVVELIADRDAFDEGPVFDENGLRLSVIVLHDATNLDEDENPLPTRYWLFGAAEGMTPATWVGITWLPRTSTSPTPFDFEGDGTTDTFDLGVSPGSAHNVLWFEDGIWQRPGVDFTVDGANLERSTPPANGADIRGVVLGPVEVFDINSWRPGADEVEIDDTDLPFAAPNVQTAIEKLSRRERVVHLRDVATWDGTTDDRAAIQDALTNAWPGEPVCFVFDPGLVKIADSLTCARSNLRFVFDSGCDVNFAAPDSTQFLSIAGSISADSQTITGDRGVGRRDATPTGGTAGWARGDHAFIATNRHWSSPAGNAYEGEILEIADTSGGRLLFLTRMMGPEYLVGQGARVQKVSLLKNIRIEGSGRLWGAGSFDGDPIAGSVNGVGGVVRHWGIRISQAKDVVVRDVSFSDFHNAGLELINVLDFGVDDVTVNNFASTASNAYGITLGNATQWGSVRGSRSKNTRHAFAQGNYSLGVGLGLAGITRHVQYVDCVAHATASNAFDCHPGGEFVDFINCRAIGAMLQGFLHRGRSGKIIGCSAHDCVESGIYAAPETIFPARFVIQNNFVSGIVPRPVSVTSGGGNGKIFLPGERITQGAAVAVVEAYPNPGFSGSPLYYTNLSGAIQTGTTQILGEVSGATITSVNPPSSSSFTDPIRTAGQFPGSDVFNVGNNTIVA